MNAMEQDFWAEQEDEPAICIDGRIDPEMEDGYWQSVFWGESYYRRDCSWDDYAPAYCVGYIGFAQYGGRFDDAEKSLCANWERIKGDSRLTMEEALQAIRAAWDHAEKGQVAIDEEEEELVVPMVGKRAVQAAQPQYA